MNIFKAEKLTRRNNTNHGDDHSHGRSQGTADLGLQPRNVLMGERQPGRRDSWPQGGNHTHTAHVLSTEDDRAREEAIREEISRRRSAGETLAQLAKRFRSSKGRITRILAPQRLKQVQELELDYIPNEHFSRTSAAEERLILGPAPENRQPAKKVPRPSGLPPYLASMYETPLLTREQEQHLFRKMNYLKHKAS